MSTIYAAVLFVHSWLRWIVVILGVLAIATATQGRKAGREFTRADDRRGLAFVAALDLQVALGLCMYLFLSPITRAAFAAPGAAMRSSVLRFFLVEHIVSMVLALLAAHLGRVRTKRATTSVEKHRRAAWGAAIAIICVLVGIPWPFLPYARPLARVNGPESPDRVEASAAISKQTQELFTHRCAPCHGQAGRGDGPAAVNLLPRPRDFHDRSWQSSVSDVDIESIIRRGGSSVNKSPFMPANPDLDESEVRELRKLVRELGN